MEEIEVKFLNINPSEIEAKLEKIGAKKIGEYFQRWFSFDYPDWRLDKEGAWIRLRDEGDGKIKLAFKKRLGMKNQDATVNDDGMEEIETHVDDFDKVALMLEKIGLVAKHYAEKKRTRWEKDDIEFDIDIYPELEPYLEIESTSWEKIDLAIKLLELNPEDKKIFTANQAYAAKGIKVSELKRITFASGLEK
jgi:adenylate cyclase, class 2